MAPRISQTGNREIVQSHLEATDLVKIHLQKETSKERSSQRSKCQVAECWNNKSCIPNVSRHSKVVAGSPISECFTGYGSNWETVPHFLHLIVTLPHWELGTMGLILRHGTWALGLSWRIAWVYNIRGWDPGNEAGKDFSCSLGVRWANKKW